MMMDEDIKKRAMSKVLQEIIAAMDDADSDRMKNHMATSMDEDSEEPIDPSNLDPAHTEAEDEGGHPGAMSAGMVDPEEKEHAKGDEDEELLRGLAASKKRGR